MWFSTGRVEELLKPYNPVTIKDIRAYCEDGTIPDGYAVKRSGRDTAKTDRTAWRISITGISYLAVKVLGLDESKLHEIEKRNGISFNILNLVS